MNVDRPEANREVHVFQVGKDIPDIRPGKQDHYSGYFIAIPIDPRHFLDDDKKEWYSGRIYSQSQVEIKLPSYNYSLLNDREEIMAGHETKALESYIANGLDDGRNTFLTDMKTSDSREFKYLLLNFPNEDRLNASLIFDGAGEREVLPMRILPVTYKHANQRVENKTFFAGFLVANTADKSQKRGKYEKQDAISQGAKQAKEAIGNF